MSYLQFIIQWYNLPYLGSLALALASMVRPGWFADLGMLLGRRLGLQTVAGQSVVFVFSLSLGIVGLTVNGALHDYWSSAQKPGFLPGFILATVVALLMARGVGRVRERHFPEIKAVRFGTATLSGSEGRVVSGRVSPEYLAGRAQVMDEDGTLHVVLCKTREQEISYASTVVLGDYDPGDGRYFVEPVDDKQDEDALSESPSVWAPGNDEPEPGSR